QGAAHDADAPQRPGHGGGGKGADAGGEEEGGQDHGQGVVGVAEEQPEPLEEGGLAIQARRQPLRAGDGAGAGRGFPTWRRRGSGGGGRGGTAAAGSGSPGPRPRARWASPGTTSA